MRDPGKNEILVATRIWPGFPDYNAVALARYFAVMKALEPPYVQDDEVAYTWGNKGKVTKCSIYLESWEANAKGGTGAVVGCEANGVSNLAVPASADPKKAPEPVERPGAHQGRARALQEADGARQAERSEGLTQRHAA